VVSHFARGWQRRVLLKSLDNMNPLKRKSDGHRKGWAWSSFSFYAKRDSALVRIDPIA